MIRCPSIPLIHTPHTTHHIQAGGKPIPPNNNHIFFNFLAANTVVEPTLVAELLRTLMGRYQVGYMKEAWDVCHTEGGWEEEGRHGKAHLCIDADLHPPIPYPLHRSPPTNRHQHVIPLPSLSPYPLLPPPYKNRTSSCAWAW